MSYVFVLSPTNNSDWGRVFMIVLIIGASLSEPHIIVTAGAEMCNINRTSCCNYSYFVLIFQPFTRHVIITWTRYARRRTTH